MTVTWTMRGQTLSSMHLACTCVQQETFPHRWRASQGLHSTLSLLVCRYAALLRYAIDPSGAGKGLFFSYAADLTLTQQRYADLDTSVKAKPLHARADQRFFFNRQLVAPLLGKP